MRAILLAVVASICLADPVDDIHGGLRELGSPPALTAATLAAATGTISWALFDREVGERLARRRPLGISRVADAATSPMMLLLAHGLWTAGHGDGGALAETGRLATESMAASYAFVAAGKLLVGRQRPDGSSTSSFPSAHAAGAACLVTATACRSRSAAATAAAAAAGALICASRVDLGRHYLSDVIAGAGIGAALTLALDRHLESESQGGFFVGYDTAAGFRVTVP